ncbi:MAG: N-acetyltransferase, partial [Chloroflexota bacterium]|nr:N-acetyltransferase [Chloroflexota bacterium]
PYYAGLLERFGLEKYRDGYAYRVDMTAFNNDLGNLPPKVLRVVEAVRRREKISVRGIRMSEWDNEVALAMDLINSALGHMRNHVPMDAGEFKRLAENLRSVIDPDLTLLAEVDGKPVALSITLPDFNQALRHANGRLFPTGWLRVLWNKRRINVASFKILGVLEDYRARGLDSLFYIETARVIMAKGYKWLDLSLVAENNVMMNRMARRLGGKIYKVFRTYKTAL